MGNHPQRLPKRPPTPRILPRKRLRVHRPRPLHQDRRDTHTPRRKNRRTLPQPLHRNLPQRRRAAHLGHRPRKKRPRHTLGRPGSRNVLAPPLHHRNRRSLATRTAPTSLKTRLPRIPQTRTKPFLQPLSVLAGPPGGVPPGYLYPGCCLGWGWFFWCLARRACAASLLVFWVWCQAQSHCRLSGLWLSPGWMWSHWVPWLGHLVPLVRRAWHWPLAWLAVCCLRCCQFLGSLCVRLDVAQAMVSMLISTLASMFFHCGGFVKRLGRRFVLAGSGCVLCSGALLFGLGVPRCRVWRVWGVVFR